MAKFECPLPGPRANAELASDSHHLVEIDWVKSLSPEIQEFYKNHCSRFTKALCGGVYVGCAFVIEYGLCSGVCKKKFDSQYNGKSDGAGAHRGLFGVFRRVVGGLKSRARKQARPAKVI